MAEPLNTCPDCGAPIPADAPARLGITCVLSMVHKQANRPRYLPRPILKPRYAPWEIMNCSSRSDAAEGRGV